MTTAVSRPNRTLADALIPFNGLWADITIVIAGSLLIAAFAQIKISLPFTPVPITGQTFAVLLVGASVGSRRGGLAAVLYLAEGSAGLPVFAGAASGTFWTLVSGGYIVGFIPAAFLVGFLAERGWDRGPWLLAALLAASVLIYLPGLWQLSNELGTDYSTTLEFGLWPFIPGDLAKIILVSLALPTAWSLVSRFDPRTSNSRSQGGTRPDGNP